MARRSSYPEKNAQAIMDSLQTPQNVGIKRKMCGHTDNSLTENDNLASEGVRSRMRLIGRR